LLFHEALLFFALLHERKLRGKFLKKKRKNWEEKAMAPKRELVLASARGSESAKRLRVGVPGAACAGGSESERSVPASPGKRLLRQTVFVVLFLVRMYVRSLFSIGWLPALDSRLHLCF
uniref:Uncharacterized protein n=1 Tax=Aegilops tauschii subsp. strangulata TaxID=200361 RepID=A0A453JZA0_AEGTS